MDGVHSTRVRSTLNFSVIVSGKGIILGKDAGALFVCRVEIGAGVDSFGISLR